MKAAQFIENFKPTHKVNVGNRRRGDEIYPCIVVETIKNESFSDEMRVMFHNGRVLRVWSHQVKKI
jgi:hypothetical protein